MTLTPHILDEAEQDLSEVENYFYEHCEDVLQRFRKCFRETVECLCRSPNIGERCQFRNPRTKGMRMWLVSGFSNYLIFYRVQGNTLQILRVIHGARDYAAMFDGG